MKQDHNLEYSDRLYHSFFFFFFFPWLEDSYIQYIRHKFLTWFCSNNGNLSSNSRYDGRVENRSDLIGKKTAFHGRDFDYSHSNNNTLITFAILNSKLTHKLINQMDKPKNKETEKFFMRLTKRTNKNSVNAHQHCINQSILRDHLLNDKSDIGAHAC